MPEIGEMTVAGHKQVHSHQNANVYVDWNVLGKKSTELVKAYAEYRNISMEHTPQMLQTYDRLK